MEYYAVVKKKNDDHYILKELLTDKIKMQNNIYSMLAFM